MGSILSEGLDEREPSCINSALGFLARWMNENIFDDCIASTLSASFSFVSVAVALFLYLHQRFSYDAKAYNEMDTKDIITTLCD